MNRFHIGQPDNDFSRQPLLRCRALVFARVMTVMLLFLGAISAPSVARAELPQRNRTLTFAPLTADNPVSTAKPAPQTATPPRERALAYRPVAQTEPQNHVANRPVTDTQDNSALSLAGGSRNYRSISDDILSSPLSEPEGRITNPDTRKVLDNIARKSNAAKTGETLPPDGNTDMPPATTPGSDAATVPGTVGGISVVEKIIQLPEKKGWVAYKEGSSTPIPLVKDGDKYYQVDDKGNVICGVILRHDDAAAPTGDEQAKEKEGAKSALADDRTRNAVMLIVMTMAVLAAVSIGFLAFDYKRRWEQEIVSQNSRLLGVAPHGSYADGDSLEPETLSFSANDYGSLDDSFDHSFRTIA